jgi:hypothetical protein
LAQRRGAIIKTRGLFPGESRKKTMKDAAQLIYVPILHAQDDSEHTAALLPKNKRIGSKTATLDKDPSAIDEMWEGIAAKIEGLDLAWSRARIYQDGVPVCGNELELVTRLAESGCRSSSFVLSLVQKGAAIEGAEDLDLLLKEYDLLSKLLMKRRASGQKAANAEYQAASRALLESRDRFIFDRIAGTLQAGELPVVIMGVMHRLDKLLEARYQVSYVIYRIPFRSIATIYNA